ncbi:MAG: glycine cleavage T C-terminal barrel domain-containing protein [Pseudomonadota bacterium]
MLSIGLGSNIRKSPFYEATLRDGVQSFSVYNHMLIPAHFGDPEGEYDRLMTGVAQWDVAAQRQVQIEGPDASKLIQYLTPRNLEKTRVGQGRYIPLCDHAGWLINDPVLLKLNTEKYWLSVADSDIHLWAAAIGRERGLDLEVSEPDVSPMAIQGPKAIDVARALFGDVALGLKYFGFVDTALGDIPVLLARSGWSKQGGFELYLQDASRGDELWDLVKAAGQAFGIGPGAPNDIERLESGLVSYGADMRWQTYRATPYEMGFGAMINLDSGHDFVGRDALLGLSQSAPKRVRMGFSIAQDPVFPGHPVPLYADGREAGFVSEFTFSKRLGKTIGVGLLAAELTTGNPALYVELENIAYAVQICDIPFT